MTIAWEVDFCGRGEVQEPGLAAGMRPIMTFRGVIFDLAGRLYLHGFAPVLVGGDLSGSAQSPIRDVEVPAVSHSRVFPLSITPHFPAITVCSERDEEGSCRTRHYP